MTTDNTDVKTVRHDITFDSAGTHCAAWHFPAAIDEFTTPAGRPVMVLAHGLAGTMDSGLEQFATSFAAAGIDAFTFDYRGFGASDGSPRQTVSIEAQVADWRAAIAAASRLPGVDPQRIVLWGVSLAGGHVLRIAAERDDLAGVIAVVPMVDGLAAAKHALPHHPKRQLLASTARGIRSRVAAKRGREPVMMPVVARPGEVGALTLSGAYEDYLSIAGPTWRNEIAADVTLELGSRVPLQTADRITCPVLVQVADFDRSAPPFAAMTAAAKARAEVRHYPGDHFDVFPGKPSHARVVEHALVFLRRKLTPPRGQESRVEGARIAR